MTYREQAVDAVRQSTIKGVIDRDAVVERITTIIASYYEPADKLASQLHKLIGDETALTIPLADGCTVKIRFSAPVTKKNMEAFSRILQSIAENFVGE